MKLTAVGGYEEIGKNMTLLTSGGESVILDMGLHVEVLMGQDYDTAGMSQHELTELKALPNDEIIPPQVKRGVVGIAIGHGHLDHIGGIPKMAHRYDVPILATPFTAEVIKTQIFEERKYKLSREVRKILPTGRVNLGKRFSVEFVPAAHSIPDAAILAVRTPEGLVVYANDYKFDDHPMLGHKTDVRRLRQLASEGVRAFLFDTTRIELDGHTPSEKVAHDKIERTFGELEDTKGVIATTFSSHIARIQGLINVGERMGRRVLLLGRSMEKYSTAAVRSKLLNMGRSKVYGRGPSVEKILRTIKKKEKFLLIVTGNQGEPNSILDRMANEVLPYKFNEGDAVLFCSEVIPSPINKACRRALEEKLQKKGAEIYKGLHVSGHACRDDIRDMMKILNPEHIIPTHGTPSKIAMAGELANEEGFENVHILKDGGMTDF